MALLEVEHLKKYFTVGAGINHAVDDVTFSIDKGKTMGVVGESGYWLLLLQKFLLWMSEFEYLNRFLYKHRQ